MASQAIILFAVLWFLSICYSQVGGRIFSTKEYDLEKQLNLMKQRLSKEEDFDMEKQLKMLNKPAVKIIQTIYGESYACVDFYKQPAFDYPLLKNHTFRLLRKPIIQTKSIDKKTSYADIWVNKRGCPFGTVPIKRVSKDDLLRAKLATKIYASKMDDAGQPGDHYAVVRTKADPNKKYTGSGMIISIYNPVVQGTQYSSGRMKVQNGDDFVEVGWIVNPTLYNDNRTHLFVYTSAGRLQCFDTLCPGIVIVNSTVPFGSVIENVSTRGGDTYVLRVVIYKNAGDGNLYLNMGEDDTQFAYWPSKIFTTLADKATNIEWGGETYSPPNLPNPPMGSSFYPDKKSKDDAFCAQITTKDENYQDMIPDNTEVFTNGGNYSALDEGDQEGHFGYLILFGGPGGSK